MGGSWEILEAPGDLAVGYRWVGGSWGILEAPGDLAVGSRWRRGPGVFWGYLGIWLSGIGREVMGDSGNTWGFGCRV